MVTNVTLTGDFSGILGSNLSQISASITTNLGAGQALTDTTGKVIHLAGSVPLIVAADGTFSVSVVASNSSGINVSNLAYKITAFYRDDAGSSSSWSTDWLTITANSNLADLAGVVTLTPTMISSLQTSIATNTASIATNTAAISAESSARVAGDALAEQHPVLSSWPTYVYGNSYGILAAPYVTTGNHYSQQVAAAFGGGTVTSYAISGKRILDVLSALINESAFPGLAVAPVSGGKWPGTSTRNGLVILESLVNDIGHYPTMVGTAIPAPLPSANTRYKDSLAVMYRAALALMSSESRVEQSAATYSAGWTQNVGTGYASAGSISFTTTNAAYIEYTVTPPQSGPLAGKVFVFAFSVDPAAGTMAQQTISVDGTVQTTRTPSAWEQYAGPTGVNANISVDVAAVQVPVDGASHLVRITHGGSAGQLLYADCVVIPSTDPNPIVVPGADHTLTAPSLWTATQRGYYHDNARVLIPVLQSVIAEFPNAFYAKSTMTANGLYSGDGIHPNDRGMTQRANDVMRAMSANVRARLVSRALSLSADSNFPIL